MVVKINDDRFNYPPSRVGYIYNLDGSVAREHAIQEFWTAVTLKAMQLETRALWSGIPVALSGGRPGVSVHDAIRGAGEALRHECWVLRFDIRKAFASLHWTKALYLVETVCRRPDLAAELRKFFLVQEKAGFPGLVEGSCIGPFLLALVLGELVFPAIAPFGRHIHIYVDDGIVVADSEDLVRRAHDELACALGDLRLDLHPGKTSIHHHVPGTISAFSFLSFAFGPYGPVPSADRCRQLVETIKLIETKEVSFTRARGMMSKAIWSFRRFFGLVEDPLFALLDHWIAAAVPRYSKFLPRLSSGTVWRSTDTNPDGDSGYSGDHWLSTEVRKFIGFGYPLYTGFPLSVPQS